jgi:hypothetical protein
MNPDRNAVDAARGEMHDVFGPMSGLRRIEALIDAKVRAIVAEEFAAYRAAGVAAGGRDLYAETVPVEQLKDVAPVSCDRHFKAEGFCTNCGGFTKAIPSVKDVAVTDGETRPSSHHPVSSTAPAGGGNERGTMKEGEAVKPKGGKQICEASPTNPDPESQSDEQWDDNAPYCTRGEHHAGLHSWEVAKPEAPPVDNGTRN